MTQQQLIIVIVVGLFLAFTIYRRIKLGGNKVKIKEMLKKGAKIIDVRSRGEFSTGHFAGAINIPRGLLEFKIDSHPDFQGRRDAAIVVYCQTGGRSALATRVLNQLGYTQAVSMAGGFKAWADAGLAVD